MMFAGELEAAIAAHKSLIDSLKENGQIHDPDADDRSEEMRVTDLMISSLEDQYPQLIGTENVFNPSE